MTEPTTRAVHLRIEGLVQGVGYRAFVERQARSRGLDGWVRNRRDGGVEAVLCGPSGAVEAVIAACRRGPRTARVDMLKVFAAVAPDGAGFDVRPTS